MVKDGRAHIESLRDGRTVYIDGKLIQAPVDHPAFRNAIRSHGELYDYQARSDQLEKMTFAIPETGVRTSRCWQLPGGTCLRTGFPL